MKVLCALALSCCATSCLAGVIVTQPSNLDDYISVQFIPQEDHPTIKADGLITNDGLVWVEKVSPIFETEFVGYDYPFTTHDLSRFTNLDSGVIDVSFGKTMREVNYFNDGWNWYPWYGASAKSIPEPSTAVLAIAAVLCVGKLSKRSWRA